MSNALVWFKRDLRTIDHAPLLAAAASGRPVLPVYVVEPDLWRQDDASGRQWAVVREALVELRDALAGLGVPLQVLRGEVVEAFEALHRAHGVVEVHAHEETGNAWTFARDRRVAAWLRAQGIAFVEHANGSTVRRLARRDGWVRHWERHNGAEPLQAPSRLSAPGRTSGERGAAAWLSDRRCEVLPQGADLGLADDPCPGRQPGGRASALRLLASFIDGRGANYTRGMSSPLSAAKCCSRLSVHFATGTLSIREATAAVRAATERGVATPARALQSFESRLHWQGHFMQKLESEPAIEHRNVNRGFDGLRESDFDHEAFAAWAAGRTGWPFVDACMRMLAHTGWINFRMRAMLVAVSSYHLWLHWPEPARHLARQFSDYEPGIHYPQVQMQSGVTGINIPRVYNPVKQGMDQDPEGLFVRRWVPELAGVRAAWIHTPWLLSAAAQWPATAWCSARLSRPPARPRAGGTRGQGKADRVVARACRAARALARGAGQARQPDESRRAPAWMPQKKIAPRQPEVAQGDLFG